MLIWRQSFVPLGGTGFDPSPLVPDVTLLGQDERAHHFSEWAGSARLVVFGYTHCSLLTPVVLRALTQASTQLSPARRARLNIMFVTVDPGRDTPHRLQAYLRTFPAEVRGFTGTGAALASRRAGFYVHAYRDSDGSINHRDLLALVDSSRHLRRV
jgi:protein SCO1/2